MNRRPRRNYGSRRAAARWRGARASGILRERGIKRRGRVGGGGGLGRFFGGVVLPFCMSKSMGYFMLSIRDVLIMPCCVAVLCCVLRSINDF